MVVSYSMLIVAAYINHFSPFCSSDFICSRVFLCIELARNSIHCVHFIHFSSKKCISHTLYFNGSSRICPKCNELQRLCCTVYRLGQIWSLRECSGSFEDVSSNTVICFRGIPRKDDGITRDI